MIETNIADVAKTLKKFKGQIPFATSRAMEKTVKEAVTAAEQAAAKQLDRPTKVITAAGHNRGAIRGQWPSKADIQRGFKRADGTARPASVFVIGRKATGPENGKGSREFDLTDELHAVVYGGRLTQVPFNSDAVITPTSALIKGLQGKGRLKKLNKFGNIAGFRNGVLSKLRDNKQLYLNVPLNNTDRKTRHLAPGLYFQGREIVRGGEQGRTRRQGRRLTHSTRSARRATSSRGRGKVSQNRINRYLVMLLAYDRVRIAKRVFKYDEVVLKSYEDNYRLNFISAFADAVRTAR